MATGRDRRRRSDRSGRRGITLGNLIDRHAKKIVAAIALSVWLTGPDAPAQTSAPEATVSGAASAAPESGMEAKEIVTDVSGPLRLATSPTGQTLYGLRLEAGDVLGIDLEDPAKRWTAVPASPGVAPKAVAVIDSSTLALVVRENETWSMRVHRLPAPGNPGAADPVQSVKLGTSAASGDNARVVVSPSRDWLAVSGLPDPMPKILRLTITGARLGAPSERRCPPLGDRPQAVTVGGANEWGLFMPAPPDAAGSGSMFSWVSPSGAQRWLHLDTGLERIVDAACCRDTGLLWALAGGSSAGGKEGLWRVDAAYVEGRQVARSRMIAAIPSPTAVVCLPNGAVAVSHGHDSSAIVRFTPRAGGTEEPNR